MKSLAIAKDLSLPIDVVTQKCAFMGRTGSGKTYAATKAAELMLDAGAQVLVIDPVGVWYGLRLDKDGTSPSGIDIPIFGGLHGDIPLEPTAGALIADLVVDRALSAILDVSQWERDSDKARFASDFASRFFYRKKAAPSAVHLFLEEAQEFCVPRDTEVLTPVGWQSIHRLRENDCVVAFHAESGSYHNEAIERVVVKQFTGQLTHLHTTSLDCAVTPDHRVVMRRFQHDPKRYRLYPWTFCAADKLPRDFQIPSGDAPNGPGLDIPDDVLRLIGWVVTDGYFHQRSRSRALGLQQAQSTVKRGRRIVDEMRSVLQRLGGRSAYQRPARQTKGPGGRVLNASPSVQFYLGAALSRVLVGYLGEEIHRIPRQLLMNCSRAQLSVLYEGLLEGDGTAKAGRWSRFYAGLNEGLADDFQELATRLGVRTVKKCVPQNGQWTVMISETRNHWVRYRGRRLPYSGIVYCLTVPSGAFVARRNGTVFVTGNCPQNPGRGEEQMLHAFHRMIKLGRNFGIGVSLISQRPQEVNKKALNQTELLLAFQMTGPQERKAISLWVSEKGADEDVADVLPKLAVGEPHIWSPQWLQISRTVKIAAKRTFNASSTPTFGAKAIEAKPLGSIDLAQLQKAMASTIEKAKETDPKELRAEVARLKRELLAKPGQNGQKAKPIDREQIQRLVDVGVKRATESLERQDRQFRQGLKREIDRLQRQFEPIGTTIAALSSALVAEFNNAKPGALLAPVEHRSNPSSPVASLSGSTPERLSGGHAGRDSRERPASTSAGSGTPLGKGERTVLIAIAQYPEGAERDQLTVLTGYKRSTRDTYIQRLSLAGFAVVEGARVLATDAGVDALGSDFDPLPQGDELQRYWLARLPEGERAILEPLIARHPKAVDRDTISEITGYKRSTRDTYIQRLGSRRLVENVGRGEVRASDNLFSGAGV